MLTNLFIRKVARRRESPERRALDRLHEFNVSSAYATLIVDHTGSAVDVELGRVLFFKASDGFLIEDCTFYISAPDGLTSEDLIPFKGPGETVRLWFLYERIPRTVDCEILERVHLEASDYMNLDPVGGKGFQLRPVSEVIKQDKRNSLRFSHKPGGGSLPVYPQILFDLFVTLTDLELPSEGAVSPRIEEMKVKPYRSPDTPPRKNDLFSGEALVGRFKDAMKGNLADDRTVHVSKPHFDEKLNKSMLLELGYSDVLGLGSREIGRTLHIKKPIPSRTKDRRDPNYLVVGDTLVLHYGARSGLSGKSDYFQVVTEVAKGGLENITIRPVAEETEESGLRLPLVDFSVNGFRFAHSDELLSYVLPENKRKLHLDEQVELLKERAFMFNFYPRMRFNREIDGHRPQLPRKISVIGRIVRSEIAWEDEEEKGDGKFRTFGVQLMYDPVEYSIEKFDHDRWEIIRPFRENRYFKDVHKSLNSLIAFLEAQAKESAAEEQV
jgi:hypothetical protein